MSTTPSSVFAALLFTAGSLFAFTPGQAADKTYQMIAPFDPNPLDPVRSQVDNLLVYAYDYDTPRHRVPVKTLKITNFHTATVYPILRDGNEAEVDKVVPKIGLYDPYDEVGREYRGYIGYRGADDKYYFGLQPGQSILIRIPLVFWNGARIGIVSEGKYLTPAVGQSNPLTYDPNARTIITEAEVDAKDSTLIKNGVVMWYKAALDGPSLDAPDQLAEWTIRDKAYLSIVKTAKYIPESEKVNLMNYDVSYVDNMFLPLAMEALDVPIPRPPFPPGRKAQPYGWIGATNSVLELQDKIDAFTRSHNPMLGDYFGGWGWPSYNIPSVADKIPAGQNIFAQSPLSDVRSKYGSNFYMLSSGGDINNPIFVNVGGEGSASKGTTLTLSPNEDPKKFEFIKPGFTVVGYPVPNKPNPIKAGTKVVSIKISTKAGVPTTVILDKPLAASQAGANFDFFRPVSDYASTAMLKLWYSWSNLYLENTKNTPSKTAVGGVSKNSATLSFSTPQHGLIEGMQVVGPGLDRADPSKLKSGVIILVIADDGKSVTLSQLADSTHPLGEGRRYTFTAPQPLPSTPSNLYTLNFSKDPKEPGRVPLEFSKKVYLIMASMAQIAKNPDPAVKSPHALELMNNVIGGNMGFIFDTDAERFSESGLAISATIRDMIKSVLRGVTDFTKYSEFNDAGEQVWYPHPAEERGGLRFNAYNLDPFVWFVHVGLGFSGYGFSLDDDTADVGAGEATKMLLTVGGRPPGKPGPISGTFTAKENPNEWTIQAPYGPVVGTGHWDPALRQSFYLAITNASNTGPIVITSTKHGLANGDKVFIDQVTGNTAANTKPNTPFTVANATVDTFELIGSKGNGKYISGGRWTTGPRPYLTFTNNGVDDVYWRIKGSDRNAGFQGAILSGPGVLEGEESSVRVVQLGNDTVGQVALNKPLVQKGGKPLPAGDYKWTLSGN